MCQPCKREGKYADATEVDHIVPKVEGGQDIESNLQCICDACHHEKSKAERKRGIARKKNAGGHWSVQVDTDRTPCALPRATFFARKADQMAGVKGRSGGPRPGSGQKPAKPVLSRAKAYQTDSADDFLRAMMRDPKMPMKDRMAAALALKKDGKADAPQGKKAQQQADAQAVVGRSLAPVAPPLQGRGRLQVVK